MPSTSSSATDQPTTSSSRGSSVTFTPTDLISRILSSSRSPAGVVLESITHAIDAVLPERARHVGQAAQHRRRAGGRRGEQSS